MLRLNLIHVNKETIGLGIQTGFVFTMHEGACETGTPEGFGVLFAQAQVHGDNKPRQIGLNHDDNMTFSISPREC